MGKRGSSESEVSGTILMLFFFLHSLAWLVNFGDEISIRVVDCEGPENSVITLFLFMTCPSSFLCYIAFYRLIL